MRYYLLNVFFGRVVAAWLTDFACVVGAVTLGAAWLRPEGSLAARLELAAAAGLCVVLCFHYAGAYGLRSLGHALRSARSIAVGAALAAAVALLGFAILSPAAADLHALAFGGAAALPLIFLARVAFRRISAIPRFNQRVLLIGTSPLAVAIAEAIRNRPNLGVELVGFLSDEFRDEGRAIAGVPVVGKIHEIEKVRDSLRVGTIVVASKGRKDYFPAEELLHAKLAGSRVESGISFFERISGRIYLRDLRTSYLIFSNGFDSRRPLATLAKRGFDLAVSGVAMLFAGPLIALCALAVKLDTPGPAFFRQLRVGQDGKPFRVFKLRSMVHNAEALTGPKLATEDDPRITRVGRLLRKTRLDELPQLLNVLLGDMSLVGPRPERPEFIEELSSQLPYFRLRGALKPGVTGWAQVRHGYVNDVRGFEEKLALDLYYMKYRSLVMDVLILLKTAKTVLLAHGT
jgi:exopolysaccharide biosynthesis polyprenyl glycosylphosphotransferase